MDEEYEEEKGWEGDMGEIDVSLMIIQFVQYVCCIGTSYLSNHLQAKLNNTRCMKKDACVKKLSNEICMSFEC